MVKMLEQYMKVDERAEALKGLNLILKHKNHLTVAELRDLIEKLRVEIL